ncbi:putative membrane protein [Roseinatronobacter thiooxidans]|uniref:Putative membrane protein n=1 Tax=Roseinatronobacter thiooxidans TaxID=121821 RepID=A0A2W7QFI3_9RHOB|nr:periplasmic heavy metal sensor [Roseinatronobacter thiooxidans]PZX46156.1 putative membrane protein [Roseinatronobacter thiooxidans]
MDETRTKRRFPWLKLVLVISVMLNLAAAGMIWGMASRAGTSGSLLRASVAALPAEDRRALRRDTGAIWREARSAERGARTAPREMIAALEAEDFDADAFSAALRQAQERLLRISNQMHDQLLAKVSAMSPQERRAYAASLQERVTSRPWRSGGRARD